MGNYKVGDEKDQYIRKYQREDVNEKLANILGDEFRRYRIDFAKTQNYLETKFVPDFPITVALGQINRCNLNCIMCYKKYHQEPRKELSLKIIKKIIAECKKNNLSSIELSMGGESLICKHAKEVIQMVGDSGIKDVFLTTNGVFMNDEIIKLVIKNKITRVRISLDAATDETYKKIRLGAPALEKVEENLIKLIDYKKQFNSLLPTIRLSFVVMDINKHEVNAFLAKWKDKVDCIDFQRYIDFSFMDKEPEKIDSEVIKNSLCPYPFYMLTIWADGNISPCCSFYGRKLIFGNIYKDNLKDVWNSSKIKAIRKQIASKKFNKICQACLYFRDRELK